MAITTSSIDVTGNQELERVKALFDAARMENASLILELTVVKNERDLAQQTLRDKPFSTMQMELGRIPPVTIQVPPATSTTPPTTTPIEFLQTHDPDPLSPVGTSSWGTMNTSVTQASWYQEDVERILAERNKEYFEWEKELYAMVRRLFPGQAHTIKGEPPLHLIAAKARDIAAAFLQDHPDTTSLGGYEEVDV